MSAPDKPTDPLGHLPAEIREHVRKQIEAHVAELMAKRESPERARGELLAEALMTHAAHRKAKNLHVKPNGHFHSEAKH